MPIKPTIVAHYDLDSFFVSVETVLNPKLAGKPVIVGGEDFGVVAACSYEARKFGVHSAMPSQQAKKFCPQAIFIKGNHAQYKAFSAQVTDIIGAYAPEFTKASIDEFYVNLTGMDAHFDVEAYAKKIRNEVIQKTKLPISFGLAANKNVAKIATNLAKPNGYKIVEFGKEKDFLAPLLLEDIPGIGKSAIKKLHKYNLYVVQDIQGQSLTYLKSVFGDFGNFLWNMAQGKGSVNFTERAASKSISSETTFHYPVTNKLDVEKKLIYFAQKIGYQLRKYHYETGCIAIKYRYPNFKTYTKQATINYTDDDADLIQDIKALFKTLELENPIRLIGMRVSDIRPAATIQENMFKNYAQTKKLNQAIDAIKNNFGFEKITRASSK